MRRWEKPGAGSGREWGTRTKAVDPPRVWEPHTGKSRLQPQAGRGHDRPLISRNRAQKRAGDGETEGIRGQQRNKRPHEFEDSQEDRVAYEPKTANRRVGHKRSTTERSRRNHEPLSKSGREA